MTNPSTSLRQHVIDALPGSSAQIRAKTGIKRNTVSCWLRRLHDAGEIHIVGWNRTPEAGPFVPVYTFGPGEDEPCLLQPYTSKQRYHRFRLKLQQNNGWEALLRRRLALAKARATASKAPNDPFLNWIPRRAA